MTADRSAEDELDIGPDPDASDMVIDLDDAADEDDDDVLKPLEPGDGAGIPQDMRALLEATADLDAPVELVIAASGTTYLLAGRPFAWAAGRVFEVQLGPDISAAALRTPDVTSSERGAGWIRLSPPVIDDHAADRVVAWFEMARRIATGRQVKPTGQRRH
jgi:hypothetical protein